MPILRVRNGNHWRYYERRTVVAPNAWAWVAGRWTKAPDGIGHVGHYCMESPGHAAEQLLPRVERLLQNARMTPKQRDELIALRDKLKAGAAM